MIHRRTLPCIYLNSSLPHPPTLTHPASPVRDIFYLSLLLFYFQGERTWSSSKITFYFIGSLILLATANQ